jgi:hypothetical protein
MSVSKQLLEDIVIPIKILNIKTDRVIGQHDQEIRAERLMASLDARLQLTSAIANAPGLGMPKSLEESDHSSSDEEARMTPLKNQSGKKLSVTPNTYRAAADEFAEELPSLIKGHLKKKVLEFSEKKTDVPPQSKK